jgi:hypothetical protein
LADGGAEPPELYGKVLETTTSGFVLHFTSISPRFVEQLERELERARGART